MHKTELDYARSHEIPVKWEKSVKCLWDTGIRELLYQLKLKLVFTEQLSKSSVAVITLKGPDNKKCRFQLVYNCGQCCPTFTLQIGIEY